MEGYVDQKKKKISRHCEKSYKCGVHKVIEHGTAHSWENVLVPAEAMRGPSELTPRPYSKGDRCGCFQCCTSICRTQVGELEQQRVWGL